MVTCVHIFLTLAYARLANILLKNYSFSSDTLQSLKRQNIDRKLYAKKYIHPVVDRNRPIRNTST